MNDDLATLQLILLGAVVVLVFGYLLYARGQARKFTVREKTAAGNLGFSFELRGIAIENFPVAGRNVLGEFIQRGTFAGRETVLFVKTIYDGMSDTVIAQTMAAFRITGAQFPHVIVSRKREHLFHRKPEAGEIEVRADDAMQKAAFSKLLEQFRLPDVPAIDAYLLFEFGAEWIVVCVPSPPRAPEDLPSFLQTASMMSERLLTCVRTVLPA